MTTERALQVADATNTVLRELYGRDADVEAIRGRALDQLAEAYRKVAASIPAKEREAYMAGGKLGLALGRRHWWPDDACEHIKAGAGDSYPDLPPCAETAEGAAERIDKENDDADPR